MAPRRKQRGGAAFTDVPTFKYIIGNRAVLSGVKKLSGSTATHFKVDLYCFNHNVVTSIEYENTLKNMNDSYTAAKKKADDAAAASAAAADAAKKAAAAAKLAVLAMVTAAATAAAEKAAETEAAAAAAAEEAAAAKAAAEQYKISTKILTAPLPTSQTNGIGLVYTTAAGLYTTGTISNYYAFPSSIYGVNGHGAVILDYFIAPSDYGTDESAKNYFAVVSSATSDSGPWTAGSILGRVPAPLFKQPERLARPVLSYENNFLTVSNLIKPDGTNNGGFITIYAGERPADGWNTSSSYVYNTSINYSMNPLKTSTIYRITPSTFTPDANTKYTIALTVVGLDGSGTNGNNASPYGSSAVSNTVGPLSPSGLRKPSPFSKPIIEVRTCTTEMSKSCNADPSGTGRDRVTIRFAPFAYSFSANLYKVGTTAPVSTIGWKLIKDTDVASNSLFCPMVLPSDKVPCSSFGQTVGCGSAFSCTGLTDKDGQGYSSMIFQNYVPEKGAKYYLTMVGRVPGAPDSDVVQSDTITYNATAGVQPDISAQAPTQAYFSSVPITSFMSASDLANPWPVMSAAASVAKAAAAPAPAPASTPAAAPVAKAAAAPAAVAAPAILVAASTVPSGPQCANQPGCKVNGVIQGTVVKRTITGEVPMCFYTKAQCEGTPGSGGILVGGLGGTFAGVSNNLPAGVTGVGECLYKTGGSYTWNCRPGQGGGRRIKRTRKNKKAKKQTRRVRKQRR